MTVILPTLRRRGMFDRPAWKVYDPFKEDFRWPSVGNITVISDTSLHLYYRYLSTCS